MSDRNLSLTDRLSAFVDAQVKAGRRQSASKVVGEALPRREDDVLAEHASLAAIEKVAADGIAAIERGEFTTVGGPEGSRALLDRLSKRPAEARN